jgi:hypothetical protein
MPMARWFPRPRTGGSIRTASSAPRALAGRPRPRAPRLALAAPPGWRRGLRRAGGALKHHSLRLVTCGSGRPHKSLQECPLDRTVRREHSSPLAKSRPAGGPRIRIFAGGEVARQRSVLVARFRGSCRAGHGSSRARRSASGDHPGVGRVTIELRSARLRPRPHHVPWWAASRRAGSRPSSNIGRGPSDRGGALVPLNTRAPSLSVSARGGTTDPGR